MRTEYYFLVNQVLEEVWKLFVELEQRGSKHTKFIAIIRGLKDKFGLHPNGAAYYVDEKGMKYDGCWFYLNDRRIAIFHNQL
jgi:hypothetical protein